MTSTPEKSPLLLSIWCRLFSASLSLDLVFFFPCIFISLHMYVCIVVHTWLRPREMKTVLAHLRNYLLFFFHFSPIDFLKSVNVVIGDIMRGVIRENFLGCEFHLLGTRIHLNEITEELGKFVRLMNWDVT